MRYSTLIAALLVNSAIALPASLGNRWSSECLDSAAAQYLVSGFASLISNYQDSVADKLLAEHFTDTSDSINALAGNPPGSVTFPSKEAFEAGQGSQRPVPFQVLSIDAFTCDTIAFRWAATPGPPPSTPVKGINILVATNNGDHKDGWQIKTVYSEFNSIGWLLDIGGKVVPPPQS